jgi:hypothetical protein
MRRDLGADIHRPRSVGWLQAESGISGAVRIDKPGHDPRILLFPQMSLRVGFGAAPDLTTGSNRVLEPGVLHSSKRMSSGQAALGSTSLRLQIVRADVRRSQ